MILKFKNGSGIHIKKSNRGKFTSYCGGKVTDECIRRGKNSSDPKIRKRATFAANARKWKHEKGGKAFVSGVSILDSNNNPDTYNFVKRKYKMRSAEKGIKMPDLNAKAGNGKLKLDVLLSRYNYAYNAARKKGFSNEDADRYAGLLTPQSILEGGWEDKSNNNYFGHMYNGKPISYNSPEESFSALIDTLNKRWPEWTKATNVDEYFDIINNTNLGLDTLDKFNAYNKAHRGNEVYLYAPAWENDLNSYRRNMRSLYNTYNTYKPYFKINEEQKPQQNMWEWPNMFIGSRQPAMKKGGILKAQDGNKLNNGWLKVGNFFNNYGSLILNGVQQGLSYFSNKPKSTKADKEAFIKNYVAQNSVNPNLFYLLAYQEQITSPDVHASDIVARNTAYKLALLYNSKLKNDANAAWALYLIMQNSGQQSSNNFLGLASNILGGIGLFIGPKQTDGLTEIATTPEKAILTTASPSLDERVTNPSIASLKSISSGESFSDWRNRLIKLKLDLEWNLIDGAPKGWTPEEYGLYTGLLKFR